MDSDHNGYDTAVFKTPLGCMLLTVNSGFVTSLSFCDSEQPLRIPDNIAGMTEQLQGYFTGRLKKFNLPVKPSGTPFQLKVWSLLTDIPYGTTTTYGAIAEKLGLKNGARAVGLANSQNPIPIIIPCHRVIGQNGALTGYAGGLWRKEWLLKMECMFSPQGLFKF